MRNVIIKTREGLKIIALPYGSVHSQQVGVAPTGYKPGDEQFVYMKEGHLFFKHEEKWAADREIKQQNQWNKENPLERMKKSLIG
jgi:hypothetical protein